MGFCGCNIPHPHQHSFLYQLSNYFNVLTTFNIDLTAIFTFCLTFDARPSATLPSIVCSFVNRNGYMLDVCIKYTLWKLYSGSFDFIIHLIFFSCPYVIVYLHFHISSICCCFTCSLRLSNHHSWSCCSSNIQLFIVRFTWTFGIILNFIHCKTYTPFAFVVNAPQTIVITKLSISFFSRIYDCWHCEKCYQESILFFAATAASTTTRNAEELKCGEQNFWLNRHSTNKMQT